MALMLSSATFAQVGIGTTAPNSKSILDLTSNSKGFLTPRMIKADRIAIIDPIPEGLEIFQTDNGPGKFCYTAGTWERVTGIMSELLNVTTGKYETAAIGTEYYSPDQHGGIFGTIYRKYFDVPNIAPGGAVNIAIGCTPTKLLHAEGYVFMNGTNYIFHIPNANGGADVGTEIKIMGNTLYLDAASGLDWDYNGKVWIDYTR